MKTVPARFQCGDLSLEGEWLIPDSGGPFPCVVVCHPHPPSGGNMANAVVTAIWRELAKNGIASFRFNFRGVGTSQGAFNDGIGEQDDTKAALEYAMSSPNIDKNKTGLAGYSFGAMMAFRVAMRDDRVKALALVSAPLSDNNWEQLKKYQKPKLYMVSEHDQMIPAQVFLQKTMNAPAPESYRIIPGADHFLGGHENEVARQVAAFFMSVLL